VIALNFGRQMVQMSTTPGPDTANGCVSHIQYHLDVFPYARRAPADARSGTTLVSADTAPARNNAAIRIAALRRA
jgi:hypothetical protein